MPPKTPPGKTVLYGQLIGRRTRVLSFSGGELLGVQYPYLAINVGFHLFLALVHPFFWSLGLGNG